MSEKFFCVEPQYLKEFKCDGAKCSAKCCRSAWNIFIDKETHEKYSALPKTEASKILQHILPNPSGEDYIIAHDEKDNPCPFLDADNLCSIQRAHGEDYLSQVCASYPRIVTRFENFFEVGLSLTCPVAAKLILFRRETTAFTIVEASKKILRLGANNIVQGMPQDFAPKFVKLQLTVAGIFKLQRLTMRERMLTLKNFLVPDSPPLPSELLPEKNLSEKFQMVAENFLLNEIFLNLWPMRFDAPIVDNVRAFAKVYKIFEERTVDCKTDEEILTAAADVSRDINHNSDYMQELLEGL